MIDHVTRPAALGDASFIVDSWARSFRPSAWAQRQPGDVYFSRYGHLGFVEDMVRGAMAHEIRVACLPTDPTFIYGWSAWSPNLLHYVYVKEDYRHRGLGRLLAGEQKSIEVTHVTTHWRRFTAKHGIKWEWKHPYREERR